jgi:hypothetical protein
LIATKGTRTSRAVVNLTGDDLFAGPGFTVYQDGCVAGRDLCDAREQSARRRIFEHGIPGLRMGNGIRWQWISCTTGWDRYAGAACRP